MKKGDMELIILEQGQLRTVPIREGQVSTNNCYSYAARIPQFCINFHSTCDNSCIYFIFPAQCLDCE